MEPPVMQKYEKGETTMKKRRVVIMCFILAALMMIGVGYAALQRVLVSETKINLTENLENFPVKITSFSAQKNGSDYVFGAEEASISATGTSLDITLPATTLTLQDDTLVLTMTIQNLSYSYAAQLDTVATVQTNLTNDASEYVTVTVGAYSDADGVLDVYDGTAGGTDSTTVTVTFKLDNPPTSPVSTQLITVKINAVPAST